MSHHEEEDAEVKFKFVDKRRVDEKGEDIKSAEDQEPKNQEKTEEKSENKREAELKAKEPKLDFQSFVQSLAHQAMMALGLIPWPDIKLIRKDPRQAKQSIDILGVLQEKTKGNLSKDEENLINSLLYQLRIMYLNENQTVTLANEQDLKNPSGK